MLPFGAGVNAMVHGRKTENQNKFEAATSSCIFMGWHEAPGWIWTDYEVLTMFQLEAIRNGEKVSTYRTRELVLAQGIEFPTTSGEMVGEDEEQGRFLRHVPLEDAEPEQTIGGNEQRLGETDVDSMIEKQVDNVKDDGLSKELKEKGWRIDQFGDRMVRVPPRSSRPKEFTPEEWRSLPLEVRRFLAKQGKDEGG
eukprot:3459709-Amphidinium_carterae.1